MALTIQNQPQEAPLSYSEELAVLREKLNGKPYCRGVKKLLPELTPWQIRNVVNGRKEDALVLRALKIFVLTQEKDRISTESRLNDEAVKLGIG